MQLKNSLRKKQEGEGLPDLPPGGRVSERLPAVFATSITTGLSGKINQAVQPGSNLMVVNWFEDWFDATAACNAAGPGIETNNNYLRKHILLTIKLNWKKTNMFSCEHCCGLLAQCAVQHRDWTEKTENISDFLSQASQSVDCSIPEPSRQTGGAASSRIWRLFGLLLVVFGWWRDAIGAESVKLPGFGLVWFDMLVGWWLIRESTSTHLHHLSVLQPNLLSCQSRKCSRYEEW